MIFIARLIFLFAGIASLFGAYGWIPAIGLWALLVSFFIFKDRTMDYYGIYLLGGMILACCGCYFTAAAYFVLPVGFRD
jgi:hypothetical protein